MKLRWAEAPAAMSPRKTVGLATVIADAGMSLPAATPRVIQTAVAAGRS